MGALSHCVLFAEGCVLTKSPAAAVGPIHAEPKLNRWVPSLLRRRVPQLGEAAYRLRSWVPGQVVLAHVDWNLTYSAGLFVG